MLHAEMRPGCGHANETALKIKGSHLRAGLVLLPRPPTPYHPPPHSQLYLGYRVECPNGLMWHYTDGSCSPAPMFGNKVVLTAQVVITGPEFFFFFFLL